MAITIIGTDRNTAIVAASGDTIIVRAGVIVDAPLDGINGFNAADLVVLNYGIVVGDLIGASVNSGSSVTIGDEGAFIGSAVGLWLNGDGARVSNAGLIQSEGVGVADIKAALGLNSATNASIDNTGIIAGDGLGVHLYANTSGTTIFNSGRISGGTIGILGASDLVLDNSGRIYGDDGAAVDLSASTRIFRLTNSGTMRGSDDAILGSQGVDTIRNTGTIDGNVDLGGGDDRVFNRGDIFGDLALGGGTDTFREVAGGFVDGDVSGGAGDDVIRGGRGEDRLFGEDDADTLVGGGGDDVLDGGRGADLFVFADGSGVDTILDFGLGGADVIDLSGVTAIDDLADLVANHLSFLDGNAVIDLGDGGQIILRDIDPAALGAGDFTF